MDDRVLALCELSNDLLFHKIPRQALGEYVDVSLAAGREAARALAGRELAQLYREGGIAVRILPSGGKGGAFALRGQATLDAAGGSVEVYRDSIEALARCSGGEGEPPLTYDRALQVHLAHEYFHALEYRAGTSVVERLPAVTTLSILGFQRRARINRCAEVAAHAFAQTFLDLPHLPNLYDYRYLIETGAMDAAAFETLRENMAALLSGEKK